MTSAYPYVTQPIPFIRAGVVASMRGGKRVSAKESFEGEEVEEEDNLVADEDLNDLDKDEDEGNDDKLTAKGASPCNDVQRIAASIHLSPLLSQSLLHSRRSQFAAARRLAHPVGVRAPRSRVPSRPLPPQGSRLQRQPASGSVRQVTKRRRTTTQFL